MSRRKKNDLPDSFIGTFEKLRADYDMTRESRFVRRRTGLAPRGGSADYHLRNEEKYYRSIEDARDMDRNDAVIGQTVDRAVQNIIQDGFTLDPCTGDKKVDDYLYARWKEFADSPDTCDIAAESTWHDYEKQACRSMLVDGDCVVLGTEDGQLQFIEGHEVQTTSPKENVVLGVELNQYGKREKYWIRQDAVDPQGHKLAEQEYAVRTASGIRQLFHIYHNRRMNQTRGVTAFAPCFSLAGMFEDIQFAKLVQQQVVSCFAIFRERAANSGSDLPTTKNQGYGRPSTEVTSVGTRYLEDIAPGMEILGEPGEKLQGFSPDVPNAEYFNHVRLMLTMIGVNLGLPLCLVLMDGSETNFSGWRGAVDEARKGFRGNQTNIANRLHRPVYRWKVNQWLEKDPALKTLIGSKKVDVFAHRWNPPKWAYINPLEDSKADQLRLQNALTSPRRLHAERGAEWEEIADEYVTDMMYAIVKAKQAAKSINAKFDDGQPVHWRELINIPMPIGIQMTMQDPQLLATKEGQNPQS